MRHAWPGIILLLGWFAGLCTLFAGFATAFDAWREHVRAEWPEAEARVEVCEIRDYQGSQSKSYYIRCRIAYTVAGQVIEARIDSRMVPDPARLMWHSPGFPMLGDLQEWVDAHPTGTPIEVHYDTARPQTVALVVTDMPAGGPRTPGNLRLLGGFATLCVVLLLIGGVLRRQR